MRTEGLSKFLAEKKGAVYSGRRGRGFAFPIMTQSRLPEGTYFFRLLPKHPEKCPEGSFYYATHGIPDKGAKFGKENVLCDFSNINKDESEQKCYLCDVLEFLNKENNFKKLPKVLREEVSENIAEFTRMRYPTAWLLDIEKEDVEIGKDGEGNPKYETKTHYRANTKREEEQGVLFDVWSKDLNEQIFEMLEEFPDMTSPKTGRWIKLKVKKNGKFMATISKKGPLRNRGLLKTYPDMMKIVNKQTHDYESMKTLLATSWIGPQLGKYVDLEDPLGDGGEVGNIVDPGLDFDDEDDVEEGEFDVIDDDEDFE